MAGQEAGGQGEVDGIRDGCFRSVLKINPSIKTLLGTFHAYDIKTLSGWSSPELA